MKSAAFENLLVLVINLDRSPDRLARMTERLNQMSFAWQRLPAVEGALIPEIRPDDVDEAKYRKQHGKPLARAEVGCYLSHVKAMQHFLDSGKQYLLLFEDDAYPEAGFVQVLEDVLQKPELWDVVKLTGFHRARIIKAHQLSGGYRSVFRRCVIIIMLRCCTTEGVRNSLFGI